MRQPSLFDRLFSRVPMPPENAALLIMVLEMRTDGKLHSDVRTTLGSDQDLEAACTMILDWYVKHLEARRSEGLDVTLIERLTRARSALFDLMDGRQAAIVSVAKGSNDAH